MDRTVSVEPTATTALHPANKLAAALKARANAATLAVYSIAIFLSAGLLFAVQPLFAKIVLPKLGGSPAVWSVAMVFFQGVLLAGYAYAHALTRFLPGRRSVVIHLAVMAAATIVLPLSIAASFDRPPDQGQAVWLLGLFALSIGAPFFALSANAPLLQAWFARTRHPAASNPYFLYATSNAGSLLALLAYPLLVEPLSRLNQQTFAWSAGFYGLIVLLAVCGFLMSRPHAERAGDEPEAAPTWRQVAGWVSFAAVPSGLMIAITAHISDQIAAAPFLWVLPLALYLVTFVLAFQSRPLLPHRWMVALQPAAVILIVVWYGIEPSAEILTLLAVNLGAFFVIAMVCHGELAKRRPPVSDLTGFYLWLSFGGVVGGVLTGLVAMHVFNWVAEFPILIVLAALARPGLSRTRKAGWIVAGGAAIAAVAMMVVVDVWHYEVTTSWFNRIAAAILIAAFVLQMRVVPFASLIALALAFCVVFGTFNFSGSIYATRSFFGTYKVTDYGGMHELMNGVIVHGAQRIRDEDGNALDGPPEPLSYYYDESPLVEAIVAMRKRRGGPIRIGVIGLGAGSLTCQIEPGDSMVYYEIDSVVEDIARDPGYFNFISSCMADVPVVIGDARLKLADAPDGTYDVLVVDAFTSDAIPVHLLTKEAMALYAQKIAPDGVILMHVTNEHLTLPPVVAGVAQANEMVARTKDADEADDYKWASTVVAVAHRHADMGSIATSEDWPEQKPNKGAWAWTDDYSNLVGAMIGAP